MVQTLPRKKNQKTPLRFFVRCSIMSSSKNPIGVYMMPHPESVSHNVCYHIPHVDVSYWFAIDRCDFPVTDIIGEFSIIDPSFQVETYGSHLVSDFGFIRNYAVRRCFSEIEQYFPSSLEGKSHSFAVLRVHIPTDSKMTTVYDCRCYFHDDINPFDFQMSIGLTVEKPQTKGKLKNANADQDSQHL